MSKKIRLCRSSSFFTIILPFPCNLKPNQYLPTKKSATYQRYKSPLVYNREEHQYLPLTRECDSVMNVTRASGRYCNECDKITLHTSTPTVTCTIVQLVQNNTVRHCSI